MNIRQLEFKFKINSAWMDLLLNWSSSQAAASKRKQAKQREQEKARESKRKHEPARATKSNTCLDGVASKTPRQHVNQKF